MSVRHKAQFPTPGCLVEFLQGNSPTMAYVLEAQNDKLRLYSQTKKEVKLSPSRLLPWLGPSVSPSMNRAEIDTLLEEHRAKRQRLLAEINADELWQLAEGEISRASAGWFASLVFDDPDIDDEAAMGHALLNHKTHFKFTPPEFEIYSPDIMEKRVADAQAAQLRETLALHGNKFFHKLWEVHLGKATLSDDDIPPAELANKLEIILHNIMGDLDDTQEGIWKLLSRGLPNDPHLALHLAVAWGIVPKHYNFLLDKAGYDPTSEWAAPFKEATGAIQVAMDEALHAYAPAMPDPFVTIDPDSTIDRDDAFFVKQHANGQFTLRVAIACPSLFWPFGSALDKEVLRRATSLYLPEGDLHMLPPSIGCTFFSLNAGYGKLALVTTLQIAQDGAVLNTDIAIRLVNPAANMTLCQAETLIIREIDKSPTAPYTADANISAPQIIQSTTNEPCEDPSDEDLLDLKQLLDSGVTQPPAPFIACPSDLPEDFSAHAAMLKSAYILANTLQAKRLEQGAVILERPDCDISLVPLTPAPLAGTNSVPPKAMPRDEAEANALPPLPKGLSKDDTCLVRLAQAPSTPRAHRVIGELMIAANAAMGQWGKEHGVPLLYRNQDIALPPEYSRVWSQPHDIVRIARSLPAAALETQPRKHVGLGITAYATCTSPMRRYVDLLNQGQIIACLVQKKLPHSLESLNNLLPLLQARLDSVGQVQRTRPRYWKLLFFRQQGDKAWWPGVVTDENNAFVTVALPWAQIMVRGKRKLFHEKIVPGTHVMVRVGKIHPLQNEITLLEVLEQ